MNDSERMTAELVSSSLPADLLATQTYQPAAWRDVTQMVEQIEGEWDVKRLLPELRITKASEAPLADLRIEYTVGEGGLGTVDAAQQVCLGRMVAIKRVRPELQDRRIDDQLRVEAEMMGRLEHPCIPPIHLAGVDVDGWTVLIMKLIQGSSWEVQLDSFDMGSSAQVKQAHFRKHLEILLRIGEALAFAHKQNIIHRDIKPDNVVIGDFGEVYLVDWGLAAELSHEGTFAAGGFAGTPVYAAPEMVARSPKLDIRTDVYLLGATLHHLLAAKAPHEGGRISGVLEAVLRYPTPGVIDGVPAPLMAICQKSMSANPDDRYQTVGDMLDEVRHYLDHSTIAELYAETEEAMGRLLQLQREGGQSDELEQIGLRCRYDLERVHQAWPEHEAVTDNLQQCLLILCDHAIGRRQLAAARQLLDSYEDLVGQKRNSNIITRRDRIDALAEQMISRSDELSMNIQVSLIEQMAIEKQAYDELLMAYKALKQGGA